MIWKSYKWKLFSHMLLEKLKILASGKCDWSNIHTCKMAGGGYFVKQIKRYFNIDLKLELYVDNSYSYHRLVWICNIYYPIL